MKTTVAQNGVTAVELMVVISIIGFLAVIAVPSYATMRQNLELNNRAQQIVGDLRLVQNRAISSQNDSSHGVRFEQNRYFLYEVDQGGATTDKETRMLEGGITIILPVGIPSESVLFTRLFGTTSASAQVDVGFSASNKKTITVDPIGKISQ
ncbi:MAG: prepilin-type N-terminal cleavage/methylation domain-containing protein [Candidatus Kerfeldbacteria bacterium]|nr:prepilin-type N-terminal cleavage/methylation domain-containing protein [Candidatus Kerfeldbacteria bacterium]